MNNRYTNRDDRNFINQGDPRALYWFEYRKKYEELMDVLQIGETISDGIPIIYVGNNNLTPFHFDLRIKDRLEISGLKLPGKSCHIQFSEELPIICGALFDRNVRRQDHAYFALPEQLREINYYPFYLPLPNQPLHIRLVNQAHIEDPNLHMPPFSDRIKLSELFKSQEI